MLLVIGGLQFPNKKAPFLLFFCSIICYKRKPKPKEFLKIKKKKKKNTKLPFKKAHTQRKSFKKLLSLFLPKRLLNHTIF
jgi:hypothetical protein